MNNVEIKRTYLDENNNPICTYCEKDISNELEDYFVNGARVCCICFLYLYNIENYTISTVTTGDTDHGIDHGSKELEKVLEVFKNMTVEEYEELYNKLNEEEKI